MFLLYDECSAVLSGSPAVESIENSIESFIDLSSFTADIGEEEMQGIEVNNDLTEPTEDLDDEQLNYSDEENDAEDTETYADQVAPDIPMPGIVDLSARTIAAKKRKLATRLQERKDAKLSQKLSNEMRILKLCEEEKGLKKQALDMIKQSEQENNKKMNEFCTKLDNLTSVIETGFGLLKDMFPTASTSTNA